MTNNRATKSARTEKAAQLRAEAAAAEARRRTMLVGLTVLAAVALVVVVFVIIKVAQHDKASSEAVTTPKGVVDSSYVIGKDSAPVTLRVYEDFLCPACANFEKINRDQLAALVADGTLRIQYRPVAILDDRTNPQGYSTRAGIAAAAVYDAKPDVWKKFHDLLFDNQPEEGSTGLADDKLVDLATQAGAPADSVRAALAGKTFEGWVKRLTDEASSGEDKLTGTPTLVVFKTSDPKNTTKIGDYAPEALKKAITDLAAK